MKLVQYTGPFSSGDTIDIPAKTNYTYVHIGVQIPYRQPIAHWKESLIPDVRINGIEYRVNENGILEFDDLAKLTWNIEFLRDTPKEAIIDLIYDEKEN